MALQANTPLALDDYFDREVLEKYNTAGPRYTSYPTAVSFNADFSSEDITKASHLLSKGESAEALSLYVHIPFCHKLCYYCGCNKIVSRHQCKADLYLDYLHKEVLLRAADFAHCQVGDLHLGGGTPNFLTIAQMTRLLDILHANFNFKPNAELSIELDPRTVTTKYLSQLNSLGFSRFSFGVQDANKTVQKAINRTQCSEHIKRLVAHAKSLGVGSINVDLIYGLPHQTAETFNETLELVEALAPDRISLFSYAHMPQLFAAQRKIKDDWLPSTNGKFALYRQAISYLTDIGFDFIGMDHFAKPDDKLSIAKRNKSLFRNFQGYTTGKANACLGLGCSAISGIENVYAQNTKELSTYYRLLDQNQLPIVKGVTLTKDDELRRDLIHQLMCNFEVNKADFAARYKIDFDAYFAESLASLRQLEKDRLLTNSAQQLKIHDRGRLVVRNICMSFDQYLAQPMHQMRYSRVI